MNTKYKNPFEYEAANNLPDDDIIDFYIEDYNFSRFIQSTKNVFLIGERGAGKTMTLLYNSYKIQYKKLKKEKQEISFKRIGVHVPCNTPLFHKKEYLLLDSEFKKSVICEHYLVLSIVYSIADTLAEIEEVIDQTNQIKDSLFNEIDYILSITLNRNFEFFDALKKFVFKEAIETQKKINSADTDAFYENALSFSSIVMPLIDVIQKVEVLKEAHFLLMIDDAHDLNKYQVRTLNSWIAYRDHSKFSFKVATAKINRPELITATGGTILEGHDFISIDMEKAFQNEHSDFYKMAKDIVQKRLKNVGQHDISAEDFFPVNPSFLDDLKKCEAKTREIAEEKFRAGKIKKVSDYVYKYARAEYFRERSPKANLPPYSGFEIITDVSTGVIRNLLDPCYWMYDVEVSKTGNYNITHIPPSTQNHIIIDRSNKMWERIRNGLNKEIDGCTEEQSKQIFQLFENLMVLFKKRLLEHQSEPRAIVFGISQKEKYKNEYSQLIGLLDIAQRSQILYTRIGSSKDLGKQEVYYVPNRLLFPSRGLDPHGQHSRVSLKAIDLWYAASKNTAIPFNKDEDKNDLNIQSNLFENE